MHFGMQKHSHFERTIIQIKKPYTKYKKNQKCSGTGGASKCPGGMASNDPPAYMLIQICLASYLKINYAEKTV